MKNVLDYFSVKTIFIFAVLFLSTAAISQENCSNNIDDDGDGLIDCLDPDCMTSPDCPAFAFPGACLPIGYYPDITGTEGAYKPAGSTANVNIPIIPNSNRVSLIIQGCYQGQLNNGATGVNDLNHAEERVIWGRVELDLDNQISSGWVEYLVNNHESRRFSWVDQPMSPATTDTYTSVGYDMNELLPYEFIFDQVGTNLVVGCTQPEIDISYYAIFYGNFTTQSLTRIEGADPSQYPTYFDAGSGPANITQTIDLLAAPNDPDYIQIRAIGINQNRYGNSGVLVEDVREECISIKYILLDMNNMTASGVITVSNGNYDAMASTFTFEDYDITSGISIMNDAVLNGETNANQTPPMQISLADMTLEIVGNQLIMTRETNYADDYNEIYYIEFLKYTDQPYSSSFFITQNAYSGPDAITFDNINNNGVNVDGFVDFTIPNGAKRAYLEVRGNGNYMPFTLSSFYAPAPNNTTRTNGNQMYAFTEVNFDLNTTTGFYATVTTATQQQLYAWQEVPINPGVDLTTTGIYGQLPSSDERINFEIIAPDIFRVHLSNDQIAYERTLQITFLGSKVNLVYSTFDQNTTISNGCDSAYFDMEICNSGGSDLTQPVPVSFYYGDPTTDPTAVYLQTEMYDLQIEQGQCESFTFGVDIASLGGALTGEITVVLNDNGSFAGAPGTVIPSTFDPIDLFDQGNPVLECEFEYNIISANYTITPPPPPTITFNENTFVICPADDATIIGTPSGTIGDVTYSWSPEPGSTNTLTVSPNVLTWYYLTVEDECNSVIDSVKVEIGSVDITDIDVVDATNCPGLPGTPGSITVTPADPSWQYTLTGGGDVFGPQTSSTFINLDGGIIYFLNVVDDAGCEIDTAVFVGLGANPVVATWVPSALGDVTCFGDFNGTAQITNITGGIQPPYDVTWTHTTGLYDQENDVPVNGGDAINNLMGGNWVVTVTDQEGCAWSQLFSIYEPAELTLNFNANQPLCYQFNDGSVTVNTTGGNGGNTFVISNAAGTQLNASNSNTANQLVSGWYYATITDSEGCFTEDSIFLNQPGQLDVDLVITDPLCYGYITGMAIADTVYNYQGSYNDVGYFWAPNPSGTNGLGADTLQNLPEGTYILTINDANGCSRQFDFEITYPDSMYFSEFGMHPAYCRLFSYQSGNGVVYAAAAGGTGNFSYNWINYDTDESSTNSTWGGLDPGEYTIFVIDDNGCVLTDVIELDSLNPIADFEMTSPQFTSNYYGTAPVDVTFINQSLYFANPFDPFADTTFFWNFNSPTGPWILSQDVNETFDSTYLVGGTHNVCLVALNKNGCSDTLCKPLVIYDGLVFEPINIFTPNNDGINDGFTFDFKSIAVSEFNCVIVNRWGVVMYEMTSITDSWNGTDKNGSKCTDGVYFYTYEGVADNGEEFSGQGSVTIVDSK